MLRQPQDKGASDVRLEPTRGPALRARALVVGEDQRLRRSVRRRLREAGFAVVTVDDGIDALILAHRDPPDLIVADHLIGWLDIRYLLAVLKDDARTASIPVLLLTPRADGLLTRTCRELGATVLVKRKRGRAGSHGDVLERTESVG